MNEAAYSRNMWIQQLSVYFWDLCKLLSEQRISYNDFLFDFLCDYQQRYEKNGIIFRDVNSMKRYFNLQYTMSPLDSWDLLKKQILKNMSYVSTFEITKIFFWWLNNKGLSDRQWNILCLLFIPDALRIKLLRKYIDLLSEEETSDLFEISKNYSTLHSQIIYSSLMNMMDCVFLGSSGGNKKIIDKIIKLNPYENSDSFVKLGKYLSNLISHNRTYNFMEKNWTYQNAINIMNSDNCHEMYVNHLPMLIDEIVNMISIERYIEPFVMQIIKKYIDCSTVNFSYLHFILRCSHYSMFRFLFYKNKN